MSTPTSTSSTDAGGTVTPFFDDEDLPDLPPGLTPEQQQLVQDLTLQAATAFALDDSDIQDLADAIAAGRDLSYKAAYNDAADIFKAPNFDDVDDTLDPDANPDDENADEAQQSAIGIAATYHQNLASQAMQQVLNFLPMPGMGGEGAHAAEAALGTVAQPLATNLSQWAAQRADYKAPQIANAETAAAADAGTRDAVSDAVDYSLNGNLLPEGFTAPDLSQFYLTVLPESAEEPLCGEFAGETFSLDDIANIPYFPMHPNCVHEIVVMEGSLVVAENAEDELDVEALAGLDEQTVLDTAQAAQADLNAEGEALAAAANADAANISEEEGAAWAAENDAQAAAEDAARQRRTPQPPSMRNLLGEPVGDAHTRTQFRRFDTRLPTSGDELKRLAHQQETLFGAGGGIHGAKALKAQVVKQLADRMAKDPNWQAVIEALKSKDGTAAADKLVKTWAVGGTGPLIVAMQQAVRDEFALTDAAMSYTKAQIKAATTKFGADEVQAGLRAFSRAMYENAQEYLAEHGIDEVVLYRGMAWKEGKGPAGVAFDEVTRKLDVQLNPISSFSGTITEAYTFARYTGEGQGDLMIVATRVPADRVLSLSMAGIGCRDEVEYTVLGGREEAWAATGKSLNEFGQWQTIGATTREFAEASARDLGKEIAPEVAIALKVPGLDPRDATLSGKAQGWLRDLDRMTTSKQVRDFLTSEVRTYFDLPASTKLDVTTLREFAKGLVRLQDQFADAFRDLRYIGFSNKPGAKKALAQLFPETKGVPPKGWVGGTFRLKDAPLKLSYLTMDSGSAMIFDAGMFEDRAAFETFADRAIRTGFWADGSKDMGYVVAHEFGHVLQDVLAERTEFPATIINPKKAEAAAIASAKKAYPELLRGADEAIKVTPISAYAATERDEYWAEAFAAQRYATDAGLRDSIYLTRQREILDALTGRADLPEGVTARAELAEARSTAATVTEAARARDWPPLSENQFDRLLETREHFYESEWGGKQHVWRGVVDGRTYFVKQGDGAYNDFVQKLARFLGHEDRYIPVQSIAREDGTYLVSPWVEGTWGDNLTAEQRAQWLSDAVMTQDERLRQSVTDYLIGDGDRGGQNMLLTPDGHIMEADFEGGVGRMTYWTPEHLQALFEPNVEASVKDTTAARLKKIKLPPETIDWIKGEVLAPERREQIVQMVRDLVPPVPDVSGFAAAEAEYRLEEYAGELSQIAGIEARLDVLGELVEQPNPTIGTWSKIGSRTSWQKQIDRRTLELRAEEAGAGAKGAKAAETAEAERFPATYKELAGYEPVAGPSGSQEGQWYRDPKTGTRYYAKPGIDAAHAYNEVGGTTAYRVLAGLTPGRDVPEVRVLKDAATKTTYIVSKEVPGVAVKTPAWWESAAAAQTRSEAERAWAYDVFLSHWDVVGTGFDNLLVDGATGNPVRIEAGGGMKFRAQGALKDSWKPGGAWDEPWSLRGVEHAGRSGNWQAGVIFGGITDARAADLLAEAAASIDARLPELEKAWKDAGMPGAQVKANAAVLRDRIARAPEVEAELRESGAAGADMRMLRGPAGVTADYPLELGSAPAGEMRARMDGVNDAIQGNADAVQAKVELTDALIDRLKGNDAWQQVVEHFKGIGNSEYDTARQLIAQWAAASNDGDLALALQMAAQREFDMSPSALWHDEYMQGRALKLFGDDIPGLQAFLRAMYDETQAWFSERGITTIRVYRGAAWYAPEVAPATLAWDGKGAAAEIALGPMSSWSTVDAVGYSFTSSPSTGALGEYRALFSADVPVERVLSVPRTGFGALRESEAVVLGDVRDTVAVYSWNNARSPWPPLQKVTQELDRVHADAAATRAAGGEFLPPEPPKMRNLVGPVEEPAVAAGLPVVTVERDTATGDALASLFKRDLSDAEIGALVGAPDGATVYAVADPESLRYASARNNIRGKAELLLTLRGPDGSYQASRIVLKLPNGKLAMQNELFEVAKEYQGKGLGTQVFTDQVKALTDRGFDRIITTASREDGTYGLYRNGYYTWPRLGYQGKLPDAVAAKLRQDVASGTLPKKFSTYTKVEQLMKSPEGVAWWKTNGSEIDLSFSLKPGSASHKTLDAYNAAREAKAAAAEAERVAAEARAARAAERAERLAANGGTLSPLSTNLGDAAALRQEERDARQRLDMSDRSEDRLTTYQRVSSAIASRLEGDADWAATFPAVKAKDGPAAARKLLQQWMLGGKSPLMVALQKAAAEEFGLATELHFTATQLAAAEAKFGSIHAGLRSFLREMYENTQEWLAEQGATDVVVYRGMAWNSTKKVPDGILLDQKPHITSVTLNPISSFTASGNLAGGFAAGVKGGGAVVAVRVPADRLLSVGMTGFGTKMEAEYVVLGGTDRAWVYGFPAKDAKGELVGVTGAELYRALGDASEAAPAAEGAIVPKMRNLIGPADDGEAAPLAVTVKRDPMADPILEDAFGHDLGDHEVARLVGAPNLPGVLVRTTEDAGQVEIRLEGPEIVANGQRVPAWTADRHFEIVGEGADRRLVLHNDYFTVRPALRQSGIGTAVFAEEVEQAARMGVDEIETYAVRAENAANGYYTWARLGYNHTFTEGELAKLPDFARSAGVTDLHSLMATPAGAAWWREYGWSVEGTFDLAEGSASREILSAYLEQHGLATTEARTERVEQAVREGNQQVPHAPSRDTAPASAGGEQPAIPDLSATTGTTVEQDVFLAQLQGAIGTDITSEGHAISVGAQVRDYLHSQLPDGLAEAAAQEARIRVFAGDGLVRLDMPGLTEDDIAWIKGEPGQAAAHGGAHFGNAGLMYNNRMRAATAALLDAHRGVGEAELDLLSNLARHDELVADGVQAAANLLPSEWIAASNAAGTLAVERTLRDEGAGWYMADKGNGGGTISLRHNKKITEHEMITLGVHELGHRMEDAIPGIWEMEKAFYERRTVGDALVPLTNGISLKTRLDEWADEYLGAEPIPVRRPSFVPSPQQYFEHYELLSNGLQWVLGYDALAGRYLAQDPEFHQFILGILFGKAGGVPGADTLDASVFDLTPKAVEAASEAWQDWLATLPVAWQTPQPSPSPTAASPSPARVGVSR